MAGAPEPRSARPLLVLRPRGGELARARQHAGLLREAGGAPEVLGFYRRMPEGLLVQSPPDTPGGRLERVATRPVFDLLLRRLASARPAAARRRSRAFLAALGRPPSEERFLLVTDLFQNLVGLAGQLSFGPFRRRALAALPPACSTLVAWGPASAGGALRHARNFDFPGIGVWDRWPTVVLHTPEQGPRYGTVTARGADVACVTAFSEAGLVLTTHTRFHRDVSFSGQAIVDLAEAVIRRARSLDEAVRIARERRVASSWGLAVSSARERRALVIETTARGTWVVEPSPDASFLCCANRYRHPDAIPGELTATPAWAAQSEGRQQRLREVATAAVEGGTGLDAPTLQAMLGDPSDPDVGGAPRAGGGVLAQALTVHSAVVEPEARSLRVAVGTAPACWGPWVDVPWDWDGPEAEVVEPPGSAAAPPPFDAGPAAEAHRHLVEASRIATTSHDPAALAAALEAAARLHPDEPTYGFVAGADALRHGHPETALTHFERGLAHEPEGYRRGQLLLWAARAADAAGDRRRGATLRGELLATTHPLLADHREGARQEGLRPFPRAALGRLALNPMMVDLA